MDAHLLTPGQVAELLQISKATAYNLLKRGEIPTVRIGTLVRVRREDLEQFIRDKAGENSASIDQTN